MRLDIFKKLFTISAIVAVITTLHSCVKDEIIVGLWNGNTLEVDKRYLIFNRGDDAKEVKVYFQEEWSYTIDEDWIHVTRESNSDKLRIQVDDNRTKDVRECVLIIYSAKNDHVKVMIGITQYTSLVTVSCSETELNFSANEGAYNMLSVTSNGDWKVKQMPEWLSTSVSSGNGSKSISFRTLSANKTSISRTGTISIETCDEEVNIPVMQYGEAMSECQVTPRHITVLSNGIAFDMDYSHAGNVAHYYRGYIEASRAGIMTNPEIISTLQHEFQRHLPSENEVADFSGLKPNTNYVIYTLAYDIEGNRGDLLSTEIKTCKEDLNEPCAWINDLRRTGYNWEWNVTMSATCYSYWMMTTENQDVALASDVLQAWWLEDAVRRHGITEYFNGGNWRQARAGNIIAVWTRGRTSDATWAGRITWQGCDVSKHNTSGDHSARKLSADQYRLYKVAE